MHRARTARIFVGARRGVILLASAGTMCLPIFAVQADATGAGSAPPSPFWVEPLGRAARQAHVWQERGREDDADALRRISGQPTAVWLTGDDPHDQAEEVTRAAARAGRVPLLVAYNIPHRDCGLYSSGGAPDADAYREWVARAVEGIGPRRAWVVLEPDAIAHLASGCVSPAEVAQERPELLAEAVRAFKALPRTAVYLDAGNAGWISDQPRLADLLRRSGVEEADGFALNVSNFHTTPVTREYGGRLSALLGGAHYIIDTSRNGNGPLPPTPGDGESWCNPPGRALGAPPTTVTGDPLVDALVWVKRPGESDGACRGAPPAGHWWAEYALGLATTAPSPVAEHVPAQPAPPSAAPPAAPPAPAPTVPAPAPAPATPAPAVPPVPVPAQQPAGTAVPSRGPGA
ncbi:glycoside hydrolase family 6 protein [Streptomyces sp. AV19]|uniref:glycoside hydrolase family 6 protein n=1 Tax=Streptomyces sp. AV19 TaxID=2793068 RepID=UPI0018FEFDC8|nr:glycoside hydrolase family 6 protein [Streptomyces sp. AV19]MBH1934447.1 glycoside hydrolase family 6 protein [Streptomyces sp. AV19]